MLVQNHDTDGLVPSPSLSLVAEAWTTDVVPRVPAPLAEPARGLPAFQRVRGLAPPHDLWRGLQASGLGPRSPRRLGAWAVLSGLAESSEAAWRQRLACAPGTTGGCGCAARASPCRSRPPWPCRIRRPAPLGRCQWPAPARRHGAHLARSRWQGGAGSVADRGDGERRRGAMAVRPQAEGGGAAPARAAAPRGHGEEGVAGRARALASGSALPPGRPQRPRGPAAARAGRRRRRAGPSQLPAAPWRAGGGG